MIMGLLLFLFGVDIMRVTREFFCDIISSLSDYGIYARCEMIKCSFGEWRAIVCEREEDVCALSFCKSPQFFDFSLVAGSIYFASYPLMRIRTVVPIRLLDGEKYRIFYLYGENTDDRVFAHYMVELVKKITFKLMPQNNSALD